MRVVTGTDYVRMSWHSRERLNARLRRESRAQAVKSEGLRARRAAAKSVEITLRDARAYLAQLPIDPHVAEHRLALRPTHLIGKTP